MMLHWPTKYELKRINMRLDNNVEHVLWIKTVIELREGKKSIKRYR